MKKSILFVAAAVAALFTTEVSAQDYKPAAGSNTLEVQFTPLGGSPVSMGGIRYRRFIADQTAFRATVYVGYTRSVDINTQASDGQKELRDISSAFEIGLRPGIEKHMEGTDRLSPYLGAELDFAIRSTTDKVERGGTDGINNGDIYTNTTKGTGGYTRFGLNAVFGADYYLAEKVYLGAELGFGFGLTKDATEKVSDDEPGFTAPDDVKGGSSMTIAPNVLAQLRLGVAF